MSNTLKVYKREISLDGTVVSSEDFLDAKGKPIELASYTFTSKRMGGAPSITASFMHPYDLKDEWTGNECVEFRGENFFISGTPSVSFDNTNVMYKHECTFVSERSVLDSVYFFDTVSGSNENDKPLLSSISFSFFGDINTLAYRLNKSLQATGLQVYDYGTGEITGYRVVIDSGISSENKMLTFDSQYISNVLQTFHTEFGVKYYFDGKVVHIGEYQNEISEPLRYGSKSSLLSITKNNTKNKIITSITGVGSEDNIPYYYPNQTEKGNIIVTASDADIKVVNLQRFVQNVEENDSIIYAQAIIQEDSRAEMLLKASGFEDFKTVSRGDEITIPTKENTDNTAVNPYCDVTYEQGFEVIQRGFVSFDIERGNPKNGVFKKVRLHRKRLFDDNLTDIIKVWDDLDIELLGGESFEIGFIEEGYYKLSFDYSYTSIASPKNYKDSFNVLFSSDANWINTSTRKIIEDLSLIGVKETGENKDGAMFSYRVESYTQPQKNLMPPIYRKNNERFYHAINNKYDGFSFEHEYKEGKPIEHFQSFPDIKPTITKMMAYGQRIDMFEEFAFDEKDDDSTILNGDNLEYQHPYFFAKLRPLGFNLFDHAIDEDEMVISMTGGDCGACEFVIGVSNDAKQQNLVQVDENGNLLRDEEGDVICNRKTGHKFKAQEEQNDTTSKSVWVALKKDINTFGVIMPNRAQGLIPTTNDKFVILHIDLPQTYIDAAEKKLENELLKYMSENNVEKFNFSVKMSRIYLAENKDVLNDLSENSKITLIYDGDISNISNSDVSSVPLYISSYTYKVSENEVLPEVSIDVSETLAITQNPIQKAVNAAKVEVMTKIEEQASSINAMQIDGLMQATSGGSYGRFVRKDVDDVVNGNITFNKNVGVDKNLEVGGNANIYGNANIEKSVNAKNIKATSNFTLGDFVKGLSGARFGVDENGVSSLEVDYLKVRLKAAFEALTVQKTETIGGKIIISPAGSIKCINVLTKKELEDEYGHVFDDTIEDFYRCFFQSSQEGDVIENLFQIGDQAYCKSFNNSDENKNRYYWRLVVGVGQNYIDLSDTNCDENSKDIPSINDIICQLGHQGDDTRQNAIIFSSVEDYSPSIILCHGIDNFSLKDKEMISMGVDKEGKAFFNTYGNTYVGARDNSSYVKFTQDEGVEIKGKLSVESLIGEKKAEELLTDIEGFDYIKNALHDAKKESTEINGGLILTSNIQLRDGDGNVMAGSNGITNNGDKSIAFWSGGEMIDREVYGNETNENAADYLIRMDGSGYFSKGGIRWDKDGNLFFSKDIKVGDSDTLASIITGISKIREQLNDWFVLDEENSVLKTKYNFASEKAISTKGVSTLSEGGGPVSGARYLYQLLDVLSNGNSVSGASDGNALMFKDNKWQGLDVKSNIIGNATIGDLKNVSNSVNSDTEKDVVLVKTSGTKEWVAKPLEKIIADSDKTYVHTQGTASDIWTIVHNLNKYPSVTVVDSAHTVVIGEVRYDSLDQVTVLFAATFSGMATLN